MGAEAVAGGGNGNGGIYDTINVRRPVTGRGATDMVEEINVGPIYEGSDGQYYTDWQVGRKMNHGEWKPCIWDEETGRQLVGTGDGDLLMLISADAESLPEWAEIRSDEVGARIVDTRRSLP